MSSSSTVKISLQSNTYSTSSEEYIRKISHSSTCACSSVPNNLTSLNSHPATQILTHVSFAVYFCNKKLQRKCYRVTAVDVFDCVFEQFFGRGHFSAAGNFPFCPVVNPALGTQDKTLLEELKMLSEGSTSAFRKLRYSTVSIIHPHPPEKV